MVYYFFQNRYLGQAQVFNERSQMDENAYQSYWCLNEWSQRHVTGNLQIRGGLPSAVTELILSEMGP